MSLVVTSAGALLLTFTALALASPKLIDTPSGPVGLSAPCPCFLPKYVSCPISPIPNAPISPSEAV